LPVCWGNVSVAGCFLLVAHRIFNQMVDRADSLSHPSMGHHHPEPFSVQQSVNLQLLFSRAIWDYDGLFGCAHVTFISMGLFASPACSVLASFGM